MQAKKHVEFLMFFATISAGKKLCFAASVGFRDKFSISYSSNYQPTFRSVRPRVRCISLFLWHSINKETQYPEILFVEALLKGYLVRCISVVENQFNNFLVQSSITKCFNVYGCINKGNKHPFNSPKMIQVIDSRFLCDHFHDYVTTLIYLLSVKYSLTEPTLG
jgi:hypothetical protein